MNSVILTVLFVACGGKYDAGGQAMDATDGDTGDANGSADSGRTEAYVVPYWRLDGTFVVRDGAVVTDESHVDLTLISETRYELCGGVAPVLSAEAAGNLPDTVYAWWDVELSAPTSNTCGDVLVESEDGFLEAVYVDWQDPTGGEPFQLGIGELHPELVAVLDTLDGLGQGASSSLNGAYASFDDGDTLFVFGVAGSLAAYQGEGISAIGAPLPDGSWHIRGLYAFNL